MFKDLAKRVQRTLELAQQAAERAAEQSTNPSRLRTVKTETPKWSPSKFNDPLAEQVEWNPLKRGGTSFQTHVLHHGDSFDCTYVPTTGSYVFIGIFAGIGVMALVGLALLFYFKLEQALEMFWIPLIFGAVFGGVGYALWRTIGRKINFSTTKGFYWKGNHKDPNHIAAEDVKNHHCAFISEIHAIQVIREWVKSKNSRYNSYEMNLVMRDGSRINVIDHNKIQQIRDDAKIIGDLINVPVWDATT